jgi:uncharacterized protein YprB with RNaseH-like and TPR domain
MSERQRLHNEIKRLKVKLNINTPSIWTIKTADMRSNLNSLRNIESRSLGYQESKENIGTYQVVGVNKSSSDIEDVQFIINTRLDNAARTFTDNSDVNIYLFFENDGIRSGKSFSPFHLKDRSLFWNIYTRWLALTIADTPDYVYNIVAIRITIVRENAGGCSKRDKITHIGDTVKKTPESSNNNCFFNCVFDKIDINAKRIGRVACNKIRQIFELEPDSVIPISKAIEIFDKYKKEGMFLEIIDNATLITHKSKGTNTESQQLNCCIITTVCLENEHYSIITRKPVNKCQECGKNYRTEHKCSPSVVTYWKRCIRKTGERFLLHTIKPELSNNKDRVIHYDLETFKRKELGNTVLHTPYYCGYTDEKNEFAYFSGESCVSLFLDYVFNEAQKEPKETLYVNAFNGSNFDHYFIIREFINRGLKPKHQIINNGSVITFEYKNIKLFDICKHLQGGLKSNLADMKCNVQKGDFDHDAVVDWISMSNEMKDDCLLYLKSDVMGLKEIYDKMNTTVFEKYQVNLTSYISTSSLTFNLWKKETVKKCVINLPTLKQENIFRQAIRGGRTYKNKNSFISQDYQTFLDTKNYDEIKDFIVDCDVVSLYPAAMAKFEYPIGECKESEGNKMMGKMGIYLINYITNKNLIQPILGRRDIDGSLRWDLKDSTGYYTSIEIEDAKANGYTIEIINGYYWENTAFIFKDYIEKLFHDKDEEAKAGNKGSPYYQLCKLFMNGLYGKNIQRPIYTNTKMIKSSLEYWKFWGTNDITDLIPIENDSGEKMWYVSGTPKNILEREECITKPTQLGAFILAYSRRIMVGYMKEANPHFDSTDQKASTNNDFFYTDTDSLQMKSDNSKLMKRLGDKSLGGITDDLGDAKIVKGIWIAPKLYMLEYVTPDFLKPISDKEKGECLCGCNYQSPCQSTRMKNGTILTIKNGIKFHYHLRGKGLNKDSLNEEAFNNMNNGGSLTSVRPFQMKKIHVKKNSNQQTIPSFSIMHISNIEKTVNVTKWVGRNFIYDNISIPWT